jgi:hypothetical protein
VLRWDELVPLASPAQQKELLALVQRQRLPQPAASPPPPDAIHRWFSAILKGQTETLEPVRVELPEPIDPALDAVQREAVAKALGTPDLCLLHGLPGTGKSRVLAEIVAQAARRGQRLLLLAPHPPDLDRVLELVAGREAVCAVRCLDRGEKPEDLPPNLRGLLLEERLRTLREQVGGNLRRELELAGERIRLLQQNEAALARLRELALAWQNLEAVSEDLQNKRVEIAEQVQREADAAANVEASPPPAAGFATSLHAFHRQRNYVLHCIDLEQNKVEAELAQRRQELNDIQGQLSSLLPLTDAREKKRWWTGAWWRAAFLPNLSPQLVHLKDRQQCVQEALAELEAELASLADKRREAGEGLQAELNNRVQAEIQLRRKDVDERLANIRREQQVLRDQWRLTAWQLSPDCPRPGDLLAEEVGQALDQVRQQRVRDQERVAVSRQWLECLEQSPAALAARLAADCTLVAATPAGLQADPHFRDPAAAAGSFDLLIWENAQQLVEAEFFAAARRARRWLLVADGDLDRQAEPPLFHRLWRQLHCEPRSWHGDWVQENNRLCCRLRPVAPDQRCRLEIEHVADFPQIELRILNLPRAEPVLAEMVFPPSMSIAEAKQYVLRELEELPVRALGHSLHWSEESERLVLHLGRRVAEPQPVILGLGVQARVARLTADGFTSWHTCCIEFERSAGWQRSRAEEWVQRYLKVRDLGRSVRLDQPHRMQPKLAAFVASVLFPEGYALPLAAEPDGAAVECIAVPGAADRPLRRAAETSGPRRRGTPADRPGRGGAGLELDLSNPRHRDRLPADLQPGLPPDGFVNLAEARAVVRALEALLADPALRPAEHGNGNGNGSSTPTIGVVALYPAQAELIRRLIRGSPLLTTWMGQLVVDVADAFRQRECYVVLVSLTRSHSHRAVSFGLEPQHLALALTRARRRLLVFADPGTLHRRSEWDGPLDHLDAANAAREREIIRRLAGRFVPPSAGAGATAVCAGHGP